MEISEPPATDIFAKKDGFTRARVAQAAGQYPFFPPFEDSEGTVAQYQGRQIIMLGSNNYLGLTTHPQVREAAIQAVKRCGPVAWRPTPRSSWTGVLKSIPRGMLS